MQPTIVHRIRFTAPAQHRIEVSATFPSRGASALELAMAVWTPGSYLVREYAKHVEGLAARDVWHVGPRAQLEYGVRLDRASSESTAPSARIGLRYTLDEAGRRAK